MAKTTRTQVAAFANPGYDVNSALDNFGNEDSTVAVNFAPFEDTLESGAVSNPVYDGIGMTAMTSAKSNHTEGAIGGQGDGAQELPKKQPFPLEEKADPKNLDLNKNAEEQEEPRYQSLMSKGEVADKDQVKIDLQGENTYETIPRDGQTVVVLDEGDNPFAKIK